MSTLTFNGHSAINLGNPDGPAVVATDPLTFNGTSTIRVIPVLSGVGIVHFTGFGMLSVRPTDPYFI